MDGRARLTIPDLMFYAVALAAVGGLYPVYKNLVDTSSFSPELSLMLNTLGPAFAVVLLTTLLLKAAVGPR